MSIERGGQDMSIAEQQGLETDVSTTIEGNTDATTENPDLDKSVVVEEPKSKSAEAEKAVEKEKPMTAHERWKQRWEAKYSKMVPELVPIVVAAVAMVAPPVLAEMHTAISQDPVIDANMKFWTEQLLVSGAALAALTVDRLIRRKARKDEQKALEEDMVVEEDEDIVVSDQPHLEKAIQEARERIARYETDQSKEENQNLQIIYGNHILEARRDLQRYQSKLNRLNGVEEDEEMEAA